MLCGTRVVQNRKRCQPKRPVFYQNRLMQIARVPDFGDSAPSSFVLACSLVGVATKSKSVERKGCSPAVGLAAVGLAGAGSCVVVAVGLPSASFSKAPDTVDPERCNRGGLSDPPSASSSGFWKYSFSASSALRMSDILRATSETAPSEDFEFLFPRRVRLVPAVPAASCEIHHFQYTISSRSPFLIQNSSF